MFDEVDRTRTQHYSYASRSRLARPLPA